VSFRLLCNIDFNIYVSYNRVCISRLIKVTDCNNARWKLEIDIKLNFSLNFHVRELLLLLLLLF